MLKSKGGNSRWRTRDNSNSVGPDGLFDVVIITPDLEGIQSRASVDGVDFEEKLIQTMSIEKDHIGTRQQIAKENSYNHKLFQNCAVIEDAYGPLLQEAVRAGKDYRTETGKLIDESSNLPIKKVNDTYGCAIPIP